MITNMNDSGKTSQPATTPIENALAIALSAHQGQKDKAGAPYILHPLRVMLRMQTELEMIAAVLHDVVEDSTITLDELRAKGIPETALAAIDALTRREGEEYGDFILRAKQNDVARKVKLADLEDNLDVGRIAHPTARDKVRLDKYRQARAALLPPHSAPLPAGKHGADGLKWGSS